MAKKPRITFEQWIDDLGIEEVAGLLKVHICTVYHWRAGRADPRVHHMRYIKKITKGKIGYEQMIDRDFENIKANLRRGLI